MVPYLGYIISILSAAGAVWASYAVMKSKVQDLVEENKKQNDTLLTKEIHTLLENRLTEEVETRKKQNDDMFRRIHAQESRVGEVVTKIDFVSERITDMKQDMSVLRTEQSNVSKAVIETLAAIRQNGMPARGKKNEL